LNHSRGDPGRALEIIQQILPQGPATEIGNIYFLAGMLLQRTAAEIALDQRDLDTARVWLEAHDRWLVASESLLGTSEGELCWARYDLERGDMASARARAVRALSLASQPLKRLISISVHRFLGELDTADRRYADAAQHLDESLALADACADRYKRGLTLLSMAELQRAQGRVEEAGVSLGEARGIFEALGARPDLARADALAARLDAGPRPAPSYPAGLTAREVEVLRLVAEGLTDAEVADRLYLSPRTVSAHLRSVYNKIGVGSRAAAARFAVENGLI
jgi:DNA-binding CsgD family transcriptional regulator